MDSTALLSVVSGALLLSIILVTSLCTYCWRHKQPTSIPQRSHDSSESTFVLRHPQSTYAPHRDPHRITSVPYPLPTSPSITVTKLPSCPPSETGSQASYVNQEGSNFHVGGHDSEDELNVQPPGDYIIVIPDSPGKQPSSQSSDNTNNYINEEISDSEDDSNSDCHDYENYQNSSDLLNQPACLSRGSMSSDDERGSSDYVNTEFNS